MSNSGLWNYNGDVSMPVKKEDYFLAKLREVYCLVEHASRPHSPSYLKCTNTKFNYFIFGICKSLHLPKELPRCRCV